MSDDTFISPTDPGFVLELGADFFGHRAQVFDALPDIYVATGAANVALSAFSPGGRGGSAAGQMLGEARPLTLKIPDSLTEDVARGLDDTYARLYKEGSLVRHTVDGEMVLDIPADMRLSAESAVEVVAYYEGAHHPMPAELAELVVRSFDPISLGPDEKHLINGGLGLMEQIESNRLGEETAGQAEFRSQKSEFRSPLGDRVPTGAVRRIIPPFGRYNRAGGRRKCNPILMLL